MSDKTGQQIGNYRLEKLLGSGGFADVYQGKHIYLSTYVAIKFLHAHLGEKAQADFLGEAQMLAKLKHSHIVQILDFGIEQSTPYIIMNYASQGSLRSKHPRGTVLPLAVVVDYVKSIAYPLQYAHNNKIVHRDLKPENLLIGGNNDIILSDFGIAAMAHSTISLQGTPFAGTMLYSAPEQIQGQPRLASDLYALGIIVYEWLTGACPFSGTLLEVAMQHLTVSPSPLRQVVSTIPSAVESVVLKTLAKDPKQRYISVKDFAEALEQAAATQSPQCASVAPGTLLCEYTGHSETVNALAWSPDGRFIASGSETYQLDYYPRDGSLPSWLYDNALHIWEVTTATCKLKYQEHVSAVTCIAWSPDSKLIASGGVESPLQVFEAATGNGKFINLGAASGIFSIAWSPDGRFIATGGAWDDDTLTVWDVATGNPIRSFSGHGSGYLAWSPDSKYIASANLCYIHLLDATTGDVLLTYDGHRFGRIVSVAWSPDGKYIASANEYRGAIHSNPLTPIMNESVQVWEATTGFRKLIYTGSNVRCVSWSSDSKYIASGGYDNTVQVWEAMTGNAKFTYTGHSESTTCVAWSPNGQFIASGSTDHTVHVWRAT